MGQMSEEDLFKELMLANSRAQTKYSCFLANDNSTPKKFGPIGFPPTFRTTGQMGYMERVVDWFRRNEKYQKRIEERRAAIKKICSGNQENGGSGDHSALRFNEDHNN